MTEDDRTGYASAATTDRVASVLSPVRAPQRRRGLFRRPQRNRRLRWLRLLAIFVPLSFLALISTVFGMVLAFAPRLNPLFVTLQATYKNGLNSVIYSSDGKEIGVLTSKNRFFLPPERIPLVMEHAIVAIEDKRFYNEPGIDYRGIARAFIADVFHTGGGTQGASTITEQFVKNALGQQDHRTIFNKLKEAALAFQLSHQWKPEKILTEYLNTAYFGNGAYGIEAAARAYFGNDPSSNLYGCGKVPRIADPTTLCVTNLTADEAALLAGLVAEPSTLGNALINDHPAPLEARRNLVLRDMYEQGYLTTPEYLAERQIPLPPAADVQSPSEEATDPSAGYFVHWVESQVSKSEVGSYGQSVYSAGYQIHTTLDSQLQAAAQGVVDSILPPGTGGPGAALVAIDNSTGEVKAMVGGYDYRKNTFNLATQGERQPGSAFKVFDLAVALEKGYTANSTFLSGPLTYTRESDPFGVFVVHNDEHSYFGTKIPLWEALAYSDNSVFSRVGLYVDGESAVRDVAKTFGITTTISINPSMVIGGLHVGVTALDMAHAYETIANGGQLTTGTLASRACAGGGDAAHKWEEPIAPLPPCPGATAIAYIDQSGKRLVTNTKQEFPTSLTYKLDQQEIAMMRGVMTIGTGTAAAIPGVKAWGKTGTTSNYIDAWFVGSTAPSGSVPGMTVAVWVGFPKSGSRSMAKSFGGKPVYGGTYPAMIWKSYVERAIQTITREKAGLPAIATATTGSTTSTGTTSTAGAPASAAATTTTGATGASPAPSTGGGAPAATTTPAGTTRPPSSAGTVTSGGGSSAPATTAPSTTNPTPPATAPNGGITAPAGGATAPGP